MSQSPITLSPTRRMRLNCTLIQTISAVIATGTFVWVASAYVAHAERDLKYAREQAIAAQKTAEAAVEATRVMHDKVTVMQGDLRQLTGEFHQFVRDQREKP